MNKDLINKIFSVVSFCFLISTIILLIVCIFDTEKNSVCLYIALSNIILSFLFSVIKKQNEK